MSLLRNFDSNLIATAARQLGYHFYRSEDGKHIVTQVLGEWAGVPLFAHLSKVGADGRVYAIRVLGGRYFQPDDWPRVVGLLNEWHRNNRWPQVNLDPLPGELLACVLCEGHLHFRDGRTHQDFITNFTRNILMSSAYFWKWLNERLPVVESLHVTKDIDQLTLNLSDEPFL